MSKSMSRVVPSLGALSLLLAQAVAANAQGWLPPGNNCCPPPCPTCCPAPPVTCMQPVSVPCYQTVPITTYEPHHCTVMKPVVHTDIVEEPVTECRPICETRTAQVPYCSYQPVTEFVQQTRDAGCWRTYCQCTPRMSPCQYDSNPGLFGWMNRTGYEMRMAFTPPQTYHRQWVPNYITTSVPVTRMVAQQSVRTVTYNVTRMEQIHTVHKVPVSRVVMVPEDITVQRPVTVYRTIPIGTSVAWVPAGPRRLSVRLPIDWARPFAAATPERLSESANESANEKAMKPAKITKKRSSSGMMELTRSTVPLLVISTDNVPRSLFPPEGPVIHRTRSNSHSGFRLPC
jgi:hypothetical protein